LGIGNIWSDPIIAAVSIADTHNQEIH